MSKLKENARYIFCGIIVMAVLAVYCLRLVDWQIVNGSSWLQKATSSSVAKVSMDAARGEILDAKGVGLAVNKTVYAIVFDRAHMPDGTANKTIAQLIALLTKRGETWEDTLPIILDKNGTYQFIAGKEKEVAALKAKDFLNMNSYATAEQCMSELVKKYEITGYTKAETRAIVSVRYNMTKSGFGLSTPYTFAKDVSKETVAIINENSSRLPGATTKVTTERQYPLGDLMPHILGYVGSISKEEYDTLKDKGYALNDRLGKTGIEQAFESALRGKQGEKVVETNKSGALESETVTKAPVSGNSVFLTIDSNLQKVLNVSLAKNVKATQQNGVKLCAQHYKGSSSKHGEDCVAGAAVVIRVKDFAILAASTYPSYDLNQYLDNTSYYSTLVKDKTHPLINRAFNGVFTPGSSFKPSVALAALQEGAISNSTVITCNHTYTRFIKQDPNFHPTCLGTHGPITLNTALAKSCNIFFYDTAYRTGIETMNLYAKRLGLGVKTGIELSESSGILAGPAERSASGGSWSYGDTVQSGIGQSDNQFTPLQLATYAATIANNGVRLKPHLVDKITDYTRTKVITQNGATEVDNAGVSAQNLKYVQQGMRSVITSGTGASVFGHYGIAIAGKTGTAQGPGSDNVDFIGYAPYDNPEIAVAVVLEHGATSLYSNSIAKDIFDAYFYGKTVDASGNLVMPATHAPASSTPSSSR
ncbi:MAG: penicillin-binding protein [Ruminococcaceae bacterium]|nr:penicillin-binding protein [Oscillospiraceae bacterium]